MRPRAPLALAGRRLFTRRPARLDRVIDRFAVADEGCRERIRAIARTFLRGYNAMAAGRDPAEVRRALGAVPPFLRAFAFEGAAMGFGPWALRHRVPYRAFEPVAASLSPETVYQNYVGWGWWLGLWYRGRARAMQRLVDALDPPYRLLVFEGIGFRAGFLSGSDTRVLRRFASYGPAAWHVCHQGFGRSLWFSRMGDPDAAVRVVETLPPAVRGDCYSGLGLGCAFSWLDRAEALPGVCARVPAPHRDDFLQGAAFGWEARKRADPALFASLTAPLPPDLGASMESAVDVVRAVRAELDRGDRPADLYQRWRSATRARLAPL